MPHYAHLKNGPAYWPDDAIYFLTDSTFMHFPYFDSPEQKQIVLNQIKKINKLLSIPFSAFSISKNHYHLKFYLDKGVKLNKVKQYLRGGISYEYNKRFEKPYREMWQTLKTVIVTSESMDWKVAGYIIGNLIKHREVSTFNDLMENEYSSFWYMAGKYGYEEMVSLVREIIEIDESREGEVDLQKLSGLNVKKFVNR